MQYQTTRARRFYQEALSLLPDCDRQAQRSGLIMASIYFKLLDEIEKEDFQVIKQRSRLTPLRKLWIAWRTVKHEKKHAATLRELA